MPTTRAMANRMKSTDHSYKLQHGLCFEVIDTNSSHQEEETKEYSAEPDGMCRHYELRTPMRPHTANQSVQKSYFPDEEEDNDHSNIDYHIMPMEAPTKTRLIQYSSMIETLASEQHRDKVPKYNHLSKGKGYK